MKIDVDTERCTGHAQCAANAPHVYELDDMGYALPDRPEVPAALEAEALIGARACPEGAIRIAR
jgi:ferredoxin